MPNDPLLASLGAVKDEASFLRFVDLLAANRRASEPLPLTIDGCKGEWANQTIDEFLSAAKSWAEDSQFGIRPGPKQENLWQVFAAFLFAGRGYE